MARQTFSHLRRSARQPRRLNYNEADEKLDEIVEAEMKKDDLDGIPENLKIVTPLDLDAWQKVDYQSYLVKREIKIGNNARVEKWNLDEFRDWVLRHLDCENRQELLLEYPNHLRLLGALIEATLNDPSEWHKPLQFFKNLKQSATWI